MSAERSRLTKWSVIELESIYDIRGKVVCAADAPTGAVEVNYRKKIMFLKLVVGQDMTIIHEGIITTISRNTPTTLYVYSDRAPLEYRESIGS